MTVTCPYCGSAAIFTNSARVYGGRDFGMLYLCRSYPACDSYVGVHKGTDKPLGRMANKELRKAKNAAHAAFDPLWKKKYELRNAGGEGKSGRPGGSHYKPAYARGSAYKWLAEQLGISREE